MDSSEVQIEIRNHPNKPRWYVNFADFANMVKAFIGSNYLSVAFAFSQSGLLLGIIGMLVIAFLTDHCCHLIVKTKHHAIDKIMFKHKNGSSRRNSNSKRRNYNSYDNAQDSGLDDDEDDQAPFLARSTGDGGSDSDNEMESYHEHREKIVSNMSYGDIGYLCFGTTGIGMVNFFIALTQFGFCVAYFIFIGNTVHSLFPMQKCYQTQNSTVLQCTTVYPNTSAEVHLHGRSAGLPTIIQPLNLNEALMDINSTIAPPSNITTTTIAPSNITTISTTTAATSNMSTLAPAKNLTTSTIAPSNISTSTAPSNVTSKPWTPTYVYESTAPSLKLLVLAPLAVFVFFSLIRNVRYLGMISVVANLSILFGCLSVFVFLIIDFHVDKGIVMFNFLGFPVFFGMVTGAFEGIGLVIPIESSMKGNRHLFTWFLHGALIILAVILGCFGVLGYLRFGNDVHQMLNTNIPAGDPVSVIVNIGICIGILLTFPLQIFPVIEIMERYLFSEGRIFGPKKTIERTETEEDNLMASDSEPLMAPDHVVTHIPDTIATWKRNVLRIFIVIIAAGLAITLKNSFAYVAAFVGAVGSSVLAFILPCLFHLKMCWNDLNFFIKFKDIFVIIFGIFASTISVVSVIERIVHNYTP